MTPCREHIILSLGLVLDLPSIEINYGNKKISSGIVYHIVLLLGYNNIGT